MPITLSEFKSLLGKVNDGNVVFTADGRGIEKANHGGVLSSRIYHYRQVPNSPEENRRIREALMTAITNSEEGKALNERQLATIRHNLGIGREPDASRALGRGELKIVLDTLEAMQRTDGIPTMDKYGEMSVPTHEEHAPRFSNRMIERQYNMLVAKGYSAEFVGKVFNKAIEICTQPDACCRSVNAMVAALPKTFHGHKRDEVARFVLQNYALVESALIDRIFWKGVDGMDNLANGQRRFELTFDSRTMFLDTLFNLMQIYGQKKDPIPHAVALLSLPKPVAEPDDAIEKPLFDTFKADLKAKLAALFPKPTNVTFATRQLMRFRTHLGVDILSIYRAAYESTNGAAIDRAAAADAAVRDAYPLLARYSAAELRELAKDDAFVKAFTEDMKKEALDIRTFDGTPDTVEIESSFGKVFKSLDAKMDLTPVARAYVATMGITGEVAQKAEEALLQALNGAGADQPAMVAGLRLRMLQASAHGAEGVANEAANLVGTLAPLKAFAAGKLVEFADPKVVQAQRDALFQEASGTKNSYGKEHWKVVFNSYDDVVHEMEFAWKAAGLTEDQKNAELAKLAPYRKLSDDKVFLGKLVVLAAAGKLDSRTETGKRLMAANGKFKTDPATIKANRQYVDELVGAMPMNDLKNYVKYMAWDLEEFDMQYQATHGLGNGKKFYEIVSDGSVDFEAIPAGPRHFLLTNVCSTYCKKGDRDDVAADLSGKDISRETLRMLYAEEREAVIALVPEKKRAAALAMRRLEAEQMPDDYNIHNLTRQTTVEIAGVLKGSVVHQLTGLGTTDVQAILGVLKGQGIDPNQLDEPENWMKMYRLQVLVRAYGGHLDGVIEWAERQTGKAFADIRMKDCEKLLVAALNNETPVDPITRLEGGRRSIAAFLGGTVKTSEAKLVADEMPALMRTLRALAAGTAERTTVTLFGESVEVRRLPNGMLTAKLMEEPMLSLTVTRTPGELIAQIENEMTTNAGRYGAANVMAVLPTVPKANESLARPRELYAKTLSSILGLPAVNFAHLRTDALYATVQEAFAHPEQVKARFAVPPTTYNNAEAVEMQERYLTANGVERALVTMPNRPPVKSVEERRKEPTSPETMRNLVADLVMNGDTWAFDAGNRVPGLRLETLLAAYQPELEHVQAHPELFEVLPEGIRDLAKTLLQTLVAVDLKAPNARARLAEIEQTIDGTVNTAMQALQAKATALFTANAAVDRPLWQQSLGEMAGSTGGIDTNTAEGRFLKKVLDNYFTQCDPIEKRAMLSAYIRNTDADATDGRQVAEMLKGAGPLLQKMLQKLSPDMFDEETRIAIKDMKSKLAPIPDTVIQAQLLDLIKTSYGQVLSIDVIKSIGQASVGQALLCHVRTKAHPVNGEDVVIKLLRPNVQTAVQREHRLLLQLAQDLDREDNSGTSQQETFEGRYASILEEFDFTLEAENISMCQKAYERPTVTFTQDDQRQTLTYESIHSMNRLTTVDPCCGILALEKADGEPVDRLLENVRKEEDDLLKDIRQKTALPGGKIVTTYEASSQKEMIQLRFQLRQKRAALLEQRQSVCELLDAWFERALFGDGVFHNDLHPGNVMMKEKKLTVIDFGNVMRLSDKEQSELVYVFLAAMRGKPEDFLSSIRNLLDDKGKATLDGLSTALKGDLKTVFAKGTAKSVLPRALAAMSLMQKRGVPIPETVHNFAQSLERIGGVVAAFESEIRHIEQVSREITFTDALVKMYDPEHPEAAHLNVKIEAFSQMDEIFRMQGDPEHGFQYRSMQLKAEQLKEAFQSNTFVADSFDPGVRHDPDTKKDIPIDPMDTAEQPNAKDIGKGVAPFCAEIRTKVFSQADGGISFLTAFYEKYQDTVFPHFRTTMGHEQLELSDCPGIRELPAAIAAYKAVVEAKPQNPDDVAKAQKEMLRALLTAVVSYAKVQSGDLHYRTACTPVDLPDFTHVVGTSMNARGDAVAETMRKHQNIDKAKFDRVMQMSREGRDWPAILWEIGLFDAPKFNTLRKLVEEIEQIGTDAVRYDTHLKTMTDAADAWLATLPREEQPSEELRKKLQTSALDVRVPTGWKMSLADANGQAQVREVLTLALETVRTAIAPETLTPTMIKYFARIYAGAASLIGIAETLRKPENAQAVLGLEVQARQNGEAQNPDLALFLEALCDTSWQIPAMPKVNGK